MDEVVDAVFTGDIDRLHLLIKNNPKVVNQTDDEGNPILFIAIAQKNHKMADFLISNGADVNAKNDDGATLLHSVIYAEEIDAVHYLLGKEADPDVQENKVNLTPLFVAASTGQKEIVEILLDNEANPNIVSKNLRSPLHISASKGFNGIVKLLLDNNADPNIQDNEGKTPYQSALAGGNGEAAMLLKMKGAKVSKDEKSKAAGLMFLEYSLMFLVGLVLVGPGSYLWTKTENYLIGGIMVFLAVAPVGVCYWRKRYVSLVACLIGFFIGHYAIFKIWRLYF